MDGRRVLAEVKTPTTADVTRGILVALRELTAVEGVAGGVVSAVMIGTTHFTNAVVERRRLVPTACVRLAAPATAALPPMVDWPEDLRTVLGGHWYLADGGHEVDGRTIAPLDLGELRRIAADIRAKGLRSIAIASVFSPVNAEFECEAAELLADEVPGA